MGKQVGSSQMADSLQWLAYALILVFLAQVIFAFFPFGLLQPEWMVRSSTAIRATASLPLMGVAMLMFANMIDGEVMPSSDQLRLIRRIATFAAIGFLLLIPLQSYGSVALIRGQVQESQGQLKRLADAANLVQNASNEQQLREAIRAISELTCVREEPSWMRVETLEG